MIELYCKDCGTKYSKKLTVDEFMGEDYLQGDEPLMCKKCKDWRFFESRDFFVDITKNIDESDQIMR